MRHQNNVFIDKSITEALYRQDDYEGHQRRLDEIKMRRRDPFVPQKTYQIDQEEVKRLRALQNMRAKVHVHDKVAKSIEITKQNRKMFDRLTSIHNGNRSPLSRRALSKQTFHPGAPSMANRKEEARAIDIENGRLLKAIVEKKPVVELAQKQVDSYVKLS